MSRQAQIAIALGAEAKLIRFTSTERLGELFKIEAEVVVTERVDMLPSLGRAAGIEVLEQDSTVRFFNGQLIEAHYLGGEDQGFHYKLILRPWLHTLGYNREYRVFENRTAVDIVREVLQDHSRFIDYSHLAGRYRPLAYCTQYRESDLAFVLRLLEREGIYFFFRHERDAHVLVLCDSPSAHMPARGRETVKLRPDRVNGRGYAEALWTWREHAVSNGEKRVLLQSFDYQTTRTRSARADVDEPTPADDQLLHEFVGDFVDEELGRHWAQVKLQAAHARRRHYTGDGDMIGLACGGRFKLDSDDAFERGTDFTITSLRYEMWAEPLRSGNEHEARRVAIEAIVADANFRSPIATPLPFAGPETAIVVKGGADDSHADELGRVRVRFLWGSEGSSVEAQSCWLRVAHPSAGAGFGHVTLPRTGEEVVVDFLGGNPDRPIVTGRVYNSEHRHAYPLPQHRTRSLYRSHSIGPIGSYPGAEGSISGPGYNEMRFEDKGGSEEVYLRAQRNRLAEVLLDDEARIRRDRKTRVGRNRDTHIRGDETTSVERGDYRVSVGMGRATIQAAQSITLQVGTNKLVIDQTGIRLTSGLSSIRMTPVNIMTKAVALSSQGQAMQMIGGGVVVVKGSAATTVGPVALVVGVVAPPL